MGFHIRLFSFVLLLILLPNAALSANNSSEILLQRTLSSLQAALTYFQHHYQNVNLDAIIGTRIVQAQLKLLLDRIYDSPEKWYVDRQTIQKIENVQNLAGLVSDEAIPYIATITPAYYKKIGAILKEGFWELNYPSRDADPDVPIWPFREGEALHEDDSDNCLAEFFGTGKSPGKLCKISNKCWDLMTALGYNSYSLSHEVFYLEIGQMFGCKTEMTVKYLLRKQPTIDSLQTQFCANMMNEAIGIAQDGFQQRKQDLFMEQAALCGMLGFRQFFTSDWLEAILSWQDQLTGCYTGEVVRESQVEYRPEAMRISRTKREERPLDNGCLCHRTTVAISALGQYVRYILEYISFQKGHINP